MKKTILLFVAFATQICFAQNVFPTTGDVGIGITTPLSPLDVVGIGHFKVPDDKSGTGGLIIETDNGTKLKMGGNTTYSWIQSHSSLPLYINELRNNTIINLEAGNVGIGTSNPLYKLDVVGKGNFKVPDDKSGVGGLAIETTNGTNLRIGGNITYSWIQSHKSLPLYINELGNNTIFNLEGGNIGIGTPNPDSKLAVNGTIHSKEVKVDMSGWPDYVFKKEYYLPTLDEVEKYIAEKGHLENIPSEEEVVKNGVNLGEMNAKLLQKIEELTLYMIEMKKENAEMKRRIEKIEKK